MRALILAAIVAFSSSVLAQDNPVVVMETNKGTIKIELWPTRPPSPWKIFCVTPDNDFYDGLIFHRVIDGFMIQGGGFNPDMVQQSTYDPIKNEATNGEANDRGTIAMARTNVVDSATSQFFINLEDNAFLNHTAETPRGYGYAVFGEVIEGMDVVDAIASVATGNVRGYGDVPNEPVIINSVSRE